MVVIGLLQAQRDARKGLLIYLIHSTVKCEVDVASKKAIANVFPDGDISFNVPCVSVQLAADDCGLYAIVFAMAMTLVMIQLLFLPRNLNAYTSD